MTVVRLLSTTARLAPPDLDPATARGASAAGPATSPTAGRPA
ncbi:hypothetical protein [Streptomyces hokutonensis]